jgi:Fur family ferric uptake transcriptional regulator
MTVAKAGTPIRVTSVEGAVAALRERGLRVSAARRLVLESLFAAEGPVSADRIADGLEGRLPRSDLSSVYRNLETLEGAGLVRHVHVGHGPGLYALAGPAQEFLVCERCDVVIAVDPAALEPVRDAIRAAFGHEARFSHFPIVGLCRRCAAQTAG